MSDGVYTTKLKNGKQSFRASFTYKGRHISLGSYSAYSIANKAYLEAKEIVNSKIDIENHSEFNTISFDKFISLINFRDNNVYIKNPIYLKKNFFYYYLSPSIVLTFDIDDLFFYSNHKIQKRGNRLFCADFGMQITLNSRYGIKNHAVIGRDYEFINGDIYDFRYDNIHIINKYNGVNRKDKDCFVSTIHINGNFIIGKYQNEVTAAIAYNKASDYLKSIGINKNHPQNYIESIPAKEYARIYSDIDITNFINKLSIQ